MEIEGVSIWKYSAGVRVVLPLGRRIHFIERGRFSGFSFTKERRNF